MKARDNTPGKQPLARPAHPGPGNDGDMARIAELIRDFAGIVRAQHTHQILYRAVATRMFLLGAGDIQHYQAVLTGPDGHQELEELVQLLTVQNTSFFRNRPQFEFLAEQALPELASKRSSNDQPLRVWSAGCSSGEEPYSIAMVLHLATPKLPAQVLATDISHQALAQARQGLYPNSARAMLPPQYRQLVQKQPAGWSPVPPVKALVEFAFHNLVTLPFPERGNSWDIIFCRNVLIYFNRETVQATIRRFHEVLAPGGYLFLGASESLFRLSDEFTIETSGEAFVYRKPLKGKATSSTPVSRRPARRSWKSPALQRIRPQRLPATSRDHDATMAAARRQLQLGNSDQAFTLLFGLTSRYPDIIEPYLLLGKVAADAGRLEEALSWHQAAAEIKPLDIAPRFLLAVLLYRSGRLQEAVEELRKLLFLDGDFFPGHYYLGIVASELGDDELAKRSWKNVLRAAQSPTSAATLHILQEHNLGKDELLAASRARLESLGH